MMNRKQSKDSIVYGEYYQTLKTYYGGIYLHITLIEISALSSFINIFVSITYTAIFYIGAITALHFKVHKTEKQNSYF